MQTQNASRLRETHGKRIDEIVEILKNTSQWYSQDEAVDSQRIAAAFADFAGAIRSGEYKIVVVGEFSTGKSTLLNALMGEKLLPSFKTETTATVNFLRHTNHSEQGEKGCVYFNDGTKQILEAVDYNTVQRYVSTRGENVAVNIRQLDLFFDSGFLNDNVTLVDSPGLNGVAEGHREITQEQILKSHACIFVFSSDHPGSKSDFEFLAELKNNVSTIIFVLNKIDEIKSDEGETPEMIIASIQENYKKFFPGTECPEIWPIAALPALAARSGQLIEYRERTDYSDDEKDIMLNNSRLPYFETRLMEFLTKGEKTKQQSLEPVNRVIDVGIRSRESLREEIEQLKNADDTAEIEKNIVAVQEAIKNCETKLQDCYAGITKNVRAGLRDIIEAIDADFDRYTERAVNEMNSFDNFDDINNYLSGISESYNRQARLLLEKYETALRDNVVEQVFNNYSNYAERIQESISELDGRLSLSIELNTREYVFNSGLESMEQKEQELRCKLDDLRSQEREMKENNLAAQANMRKQRNIEQQLRELNEQEMEINGRIMPAIIKSKKRVEQQKAFNEKGVFGTVGEFLFGKKMKTVEVEVVEDTAYKEETAKRNVDLNALKQEKDRLKEALNDSVEKDLLISNERYANVQTSLSRVEEQFHDLMRENNEKFQSRYNAQIKKACNELRNLLSDKTYEIIGEVKKLLRGQEKKYAGIVNSVIMANLKQDLALEQKKQETLLARLNSSEKERDMRIAALTERLSELEGILEKADALKAELENLKVE